jgi:hypothetical protein
VKENSEHFMFFDSHKGYKYNNKCCIERSLIMINKLDFNAKNLTSNAGIFLLLEEAQNNGIFDLIVCIKLKLTT